MLKLCAVSGCFVYFLLIVSLFFSPSMLFVPFASAAGPSWGCGGNVSPEHAYAARHKPKTH